jgi:hypothetical protein
MEDSAAPVGTKGATSALRASLQSPINANRNRGYKEPNKERRYYG